MEGNFTASAFSVMLGRLRSQKLAKSFQLLHINNITCVLCLGHNIPHNEFKIHRFHPIPFFSDRSSRDLLMSTPPNISNIVMNCIISYFISYYTIMLYYIVLYINSLVTPPESWISKSCCLRARGCTALYSCWPWYCLG